MSRRFLIQGISYNRMCTRSVWVGAVAVPVYTQFSGVGWDASGRLLTGQCDSVACFGTLHDTTVERVQGAVHSGSVYV